MPEDEQRLGVAIAVHGGAQLAALFGVEPVAGTTDEGIRQLGEMDEALFDLGLPEQLAPGDHQHAAAAELAQDALERLLVRDLGEQGCELRFIGGPALGPGQCVRCQGLGQQPRLLDKGVCDKVGEAEQGQQSLAGGLGQCVRSGAARASSRCQWRRACSCNKRERRRRKRESAGPRLPSLWLTSLQGE